MSAFIIVDLNPTNKDALGTYSALAATTLIPFKGELVIKGSIETLHGDEFYATKVVIQFPDHEHAQNWYNSAAYQEIIPTRNQGMDSQFHLVG